MNTSMIEMVSSLTNEKFDELVEFVMNEPTKIKSEEMRNIIAQEAVIRTGRMPESEEEFSLYCDIFKEYMNNVITEEECSVLLETLDKNLVHENDSEVSIESKIDDMEGIVEKNKKLKERGKHWRDAGKKQTIDKYGKMPLHDEDREEWTESENEIKDKIKKVTKDIKEMEKKFDKITDDLKKYKDPNEQKSGKEDLVELHKEITKKKAYLRILEKRYKERCDYLGTCTLDKHKTEIPRHDRSWRDWDELRESAEEAEKSKLNSEWKKNEDIVKAISKNEKDIKKLVQKMRDIDQDDSVDAAIKKEMQKELDRMLKDTKGKKAAYEAKKDELEKKYKKLGVGTPAKEDGKSSAAEIAANVEKSVNSEEMKDVSSIKN